VVVDRGCDRLESQRAAGVVHEHVQHGDAADKRLDRGGVADVEEHGAAVNLGGQLLQAFEAACPNYDIEPRGRQFPRDRHAEARGGAGHDCDAPQTVGERSRLVCHEAKHTGAADPCELRRTVRR
jgi:hypothetical protein